MLVSDKFSQHLCLNKQVYLNCNQNWKKVFLHLVLWKFVRDKMSFKSQPEPIQGSNKKLTCCCFTHRPLIFMYMLRCRPQCPPWFHLPTPYPLPTTYYRGPLKGPKIISSDVKVSNLFALYLNMGNIYNIGKSWWIFLCYF